MLLYRTFSTRGVTKTDEGVDYILCHSNHTTSFAILLQITEEEVITNHGRCEFPKELVENESRLNMHSTVPIFF